MEKSHISTNGSDNKTLFGPTATCGIMSALSKCHVDKLAVILLQGLNVSILSNRSIASSSAPNKSVLKETHYEIMVVALVFKLKSIIWRRLRNDLQNLVQLLQPTPPVIKRLEKRFSCCDWPQHLCKNATDNSYVDSRGVATTIIGEIRAKEFRGSVWHHHYQDESSPWKTYEQDQGCISWHSLYILKREMFEGIKFHCNTFAWCRYCTAINTRL